MMDAAMPIPHVNNNTCHDCMMNPKGNYRVSKGLNVEGLGRRQGRNEQVRQILCEKFGIE